jgi:drug/metabolite transporter (DMT)-like permease
LKGSGSFRAAVYMSLGALFLSFVAVFVKLIPPQSGIPTMQKLFMRGSVATIAVAAVMLARGVSFRPGSTGLLGARAIFGMTAMFTYFLAVEGIPLAEAVTINKLSPFFVLIMSLVFLGERLSRLQLLAIALGFTGVVVILQPGRVPITLPALMALISAVFSGAAYTTLRALRRTDGPLVVVFWFSAAISLVFLPPTLLDGVMPGFRDFAYLLGIGICGAAGQLFMTQAYRCAPGGEVAVYGYLSVVFSMAWQVFFFDSIPTAAVFAGGALVLFGGWLNYMVGKGMKEKPSAS